MLSLKYEYGMDGSLEVRLYLLRPGPEDTGQYHCSIPGTDVEPALLTLYITQGKSNLSEANP